MFRSPVVCGGSGGDDDDDGDDADVPTTDGAPRATGNTAPSLLFPLPLLLLLSSPSPTPFSILLSTASVAVAAAIEEQLELLLLSPPPAPDPVVHVFAPAGTAAFTSSDPRTLVLGPCGAAAMVMANKGKIKKQSKAKLARPADTVVGFARLTQKKEEDKLVTGSNVVVV